MKCTIIKSRKRDFTYLYLREGFELDEVPEELAALLGPTEPVMELELTPERDLAQEDVVRVIANLEEKGYHLQLPPDEDPGGWLDLPKKEDER